MGRPRKDATMTNTTVSVTDDSNRRSKMLRRLEILRKTEPELAASLDKRLPNLFAMQEACLKESGTINKILGLAAE